jgi:UDP-glucose 4-epimerase
LVVVVTGGSGFIGSHVAEALINQGYTVRIFDKAKPPSSGVEWFRGDLLSKDEVHDAVQDAEAVFHLGAVADVNVATTNPEYCLEVNEMGTLNLLSACSGCDVERFVLASSVWVYGRASGVVTEETSIPPPNDLYTKTKIGQEHLVYSWSQSRSLPYTILRYDIPYGPRMRANMAIMAFVRRAMRKEPITVFGDGRQGRCWIYVTDLARAHHLALKHMASNQVINLAGKEFVTISEIVNLLSKMFGAIPVKHEPPRPGDFVGVRTSIEKASQLLGWSPTTSFAEGLSEFVTHLKAGQPEKSTL